MQSEKAAQPAAGIAELRRKAPIAYYIVSRVGGESAARELAKKEQT